MHISNLMLGTLAILAIQELPQAANATPLNEGNKTTNINDNGVVDVAEHAESVDSSIVHSSIVHLSIATPEAISPAALSNRIDFNSTPIHRTDRLDAVEFSRDGGGDRRPQPIEANGPTQRESFDNTYFAVNSTDSNSFDNNRFADRAIDPEPLTQPNIEWSSVSGISEHSSQTDDETELPSSELPSSELPSSELPRPELTSSELPSSELPRPELTSSEYPTAEPFDLAQLPLEPPILNPRQPNQDEVEQLLNEIEQVEAANIPTPYRSSPAVTISNPSGFGADNFTGFVGFGYQERTRFANEDDGGLVVGMGFGDARENVGVQLSYTVASFGGSRDFGTGGFNAKLHKRLSDEWSVAVGWDGFVTTGFVDFEDSIYGSASHIIRTRDSITKPFSRVALTAGAGSGRFRTEDAIFEDRSEVGVFGSMAVRVAEPVSAIVEWTGQDLAAGVSITPFKKVPLVLVPSVRDITGAGDGARFVLGAGFSFQL